MDTYNENNAIDLIWLAQILIVIAFFALLIMAIILLADFYIADNSNCKSFKDAALAGDPGSKEHAIALTNSLLSDGIWPVAYLTAAITAGFVILGLGIPATIQNIIIIFLFSFIPYYAMILFLYHHYVSFVKTSITNYIANSIPNPDIKLTNDDLEKPIDLNKSLNNDLNNPTDNDLDKSINSESTFITPIIKEIKSS